MLRQIVLGLLGFAVVCALHADAAPLPKRSLLIVDGMNNHDWPRATGILREILEGSGRFTVEVSSSPPADAPKSKWDQWRPDFAKYDVVLSNFNGGHKPDGLHWPRAVEKALEDYVGGGGGLVIYHSANNSFPNWKAYNEMIGLGWRDKNFGPSLIVSKDEKVVEIPKGEGRNPGHAPEHDFQVTVLNPNHPITKGLPKTWMHPHEQLTHGQHGPAKNLTVLTYAYSKDSGDNEVMDWAVPYDKGRIYVTMLGHLWKNGPDSAMRCVGFQTMLIRGCEWAATGKVTYPVPKDFPTAREIRLPPSFSPPSEQFEIVTKKAEDRVEVASVNGTTTFTVTSPTGIGSATIGLKGERWPGEITLRLRLKGLESLTVSNGNVILAASVSSNDRSQRIFLKHGNEEKILGQDDPYRTEVRDWGKGFELKLPVVLFEGDTKVLNVGWIDFFRR
ncbi:MAG: ThuA domain-containing protein [Rhodopirellula sp.]|nr:ThuA domain-containing protein [Rhodopirellula sp.]